MHMHFRNSVFHGTRDVDVIVAIEIGVDAALQGDLCCSHFPCLCRALRDVASACIDVSDGLAGDLDKLAVASGCTAVLDLDRLPRSAALPARSWQ